MVRLSVRRSRFAVAAWARVPSFRRLRFLLQVLGLVQEPQRLHSHKRKYPFQALSVFWSSAALNLALLATSAVKYDAETLCEPRNGQRKSSAHRLHASRRAPLAATSALQPSPALRDATASSGAAAA